MLPGRLCEGATIKRNDITGEIFVARVIHGGLADRSGLLHAGDRIIEVNGFPVEGMEPEQVIQVVQARSHGTIMFKVVPITERPVHNQTMLYVRAMADYSPQQDPTIPCADAGMSFRKGDVLEIVDQTDALWWQAKKLPSSTACAGLIPSTNLLKRKQREFWWSQPYQPHACAQTLSTVDEDEDDFSSNIEGVYLAGFRRSMRLCRRRAHSTAQPSCHTRCPSSCSSTLNNPYEEVVRYQRHPEDTHRLIALLGPSGVGVNELRRRLIEMNSNLFQGAVPHTTRSPRGYEESGREYHFTSREIFDNMVYNNRFLEYGEYKGNMYGTSIDSVRAVLNGGNMCVIDIEPNAIQAVRTHELRAYIIYVKPPPLERLRQTRQESYITTNYYVNRPFKDEDFQEMEEAARKIESQYGQLFDHVIINDELQDSCVELLTAVRKAQDEPQWINGYLYSFFTESVAGIVANVVALAKIQENGRRRFKENEGQGSAASPTGEVPAAKRKKKRLRKEASGVDDTDDQELEMGGFGSRRGSEVGDQLTMETAADVAPQRRRKKKKSATIDLEDDQADLVNGDTADQATDGEEVVRKPRKKKKSKVAESQLPDELDVEDDDIITDASSPIPQHSLFSAPQGQSHPVGKVFVERNKRFQAAERSDWRTGGEQPDNMAADYQHLQQLWTTRDVSLRVHQWFRVLGLYCHGFLAGYAVWNVVVVYVLAGQHLTALSNLLQQYHSLAYPSQALLYMLLALSTVAAFDRVNMAKGSVSLREFITLDPVALSSFLYFSALVLSLSQQMTSDRINLYAAFNETLCLMNFCRRPPGSEQQILHPWVTINLVVALLVGLAWVCIATRPETDYTESYLMAMEIEPPKPDDKSEMTA
ncbi:unnamed protein product [Menidia menidia]|uniref:(Atlantic silverside) hypothetical protein n=1 Tax=Menidia menidia TaxID=238744 RepID=A0A8S4B6B2_9TELE|nr:unnamed protein product [Menidia menidia]